MKELEVFNPTTQQTETATLALDDNNEIVATFPDGHFLKFPAGLTKAELLQSIVDVQKANEGQEIITPEMEAAAQAEREKAQSVLDSL